jgi:flagellar hook assembly protein FlgD
MTISPATTPTPSTPAKDPITGLAMQSNAGKQMLGADDFMKLLTTQLTSQDPMNPMKDTEFISQMANFTSLEQMRTLSKSFETFTSDQKMSAAPAFLGRNVTVKNASGDITGIVEAITLQVLRYKPNHRNCNASTCDGANDFHRSFHSCPKSSILIQPQ